MIATSPVEDGCGGETATNNDRARGAQQRHVSPALVGGPDLNTTTANPPAQAIWTSTPLVYPRVAAEVGTPFFSFSPFSFQPLDFSQSPWSRAARAPTRVLAQC